jgi:NADH-quinone oxidoreductase subunit H
MDPAVEGTLVLIAKSIVIFAVFLQLVPLVLLGERKILGRFQSRIGPNRVGP